MFVEVHDVCGYEGVKWVEVGVEYRTAFFTFDVNMETHLLLRPWGVFRTLRAPGLRPACLRVGGLGFARLRFTGRPMFKGSLRPLGRGS